MTDGVALDTNAVRLWEMANRGGWNLGDEARRAESLAKALADRLDAARERAVSDAGSAQGRPTEQSDVRRLLDSRRLHQGA